MQRGDLRQFEGRLVRGNYSIPNAGEGSFRGMVVNGICFNVYFTLVGEELVTVLEDISSRVVGVEEFDDTSATRKQVLASAQRSETSTSLNVALRYIREEPRI